MNKVCIVPASMHVTRPELLLAMEVLAYTFLVLNLVTIPPSIAWKVTNAISFVEDLIRALTSLPIAMVFALFNVMETPNVRRLYLRIQHRHQQMHRLFHQRESQQMNRVF